MSMGLSAVWMCRREYGVDRLGQRNAGGMGRSVLRTFTIQSIEEGWNKSP